MPGHVRARGKRRNGSTIWQARWRKPDDPNHRREANFRTRREAERWVTAMESGVSRGQYADPRKGERPFLEVADAWRKTWGNLEPKTRAGYEAILDRWLIGDRDPLHPSRPARFRNTKVAAISAETVEEFFNEIGEHRAPNTVRRIYSVLRGILNLAVRRGYIVVNPCDPVDLPSKKRVGVRRSHLYLEGSELRKLADAMPEHWRLAVLVAGSCGLRAGELWALRRRDANVPLGTLTIRWALKEINSSADSLANDKGLIVGPPKSAASRATIKIPGDLGPLLSAALLDVGICAEGKGYAVLHEVNEERCDLGFTDDPSDPNRLLFTTPSGYPVRHNQFYKRSFRPVVERRDCAGCGKAVADDADHCPECGSDRLSYILPPRLHGVRWHDLRHTAAVLALYASGGNLALVKERLRHEHIATTIDLYGKYVPSLDAALADAVGASIFAPADNSTEAVALVSA